MWCNQIAPHSQNQATTDDNKASNQCKGRPDMTKTQQIVCGPQRWALNRGIKPRLWSYVAPMPSNLACEAMRHRCHQTSPVKLRGTDAIKPRLWSYVAPMPSNHVCEATWHLCHQTTPVKLRGTDAIKPRLWSYVAPMPSNHACEATWHRCHQEFRHRPHTPWGRSSI